METDFTHSDVDVGLEDLEIVLVGPRLSRLYHRGDSVDLHVAIFDQFLQIVVRGYGQLQLFRWKTNDISDRRMTLTKTRHLTEA